MKNKTCFPLVIFFCLFSVNFSWGNELKEKILHPFVRVLSASGVIIKSWTDEKGDSYAFVLSGQHVTKHAADQNSVSADFIWFDENGKIEKTTKLLGRVLESDEKADYSIIFYKTPVKFSCVTYSTKNLSILDIVYIVGAPNRQNIWVTQGIISSLNVNGELPPGYFGQSAGMYFGSSGSPLFNKDGELIGINLRVSAGQDGAIPYMGISLEIKEIFKLLGEEKVKFYFK